MKAIIDIDKKLAILAGHENYGEKEIEFAVSELSKLERQEFLMSHFDCKKTAYELTENSLHYAGLAYEFQVQEKIGIENPGIAEIKKILQSRIESRKKQDAYEIIKKQKKEKQEKKDKIENEQKIKNMLENNNLSDLSYYFSSYEKYMTDEQKEKVKNYRLEQKKIEKKEIEKKEEKRKKFENEKNEWCKEKGSDRLYEGMKAGYNINRLYIEERAEEELSKFGTVIFDSKGREEIEIKDRNCPSLEKLRLEEKIKEAGYKCEIVWCVDNRDVEYNNEYPDQFEAIWIKFLGKYDIYIK